MDRPEPADRRTPTRRRLRIAGFMRRVDWLTRDLWRATQRRLERTPGVAASAFDPDCGQQDMRRWGPDGVVAHIHRRDMVDLLLDFGVPVVNTSGIFDDLPFPSVLPDNVAAGRLAADHLLAKGYERFAYIGQLNHGYARDRLSGFRRRLAEAGHDTDVYGKIPPSLHHIVRREETDRLDPFVAWARKLTPGTGILTVDDGPARALVEVLRVYDMIAPESLGVVSGHDREIPCNPSLTAVLIPEQAWGEDAGRLVLDMVRGAPAPESPVLLPPLGVTERESTAGVATDDALLRDAAMFIRDHADRDISVGDVADAVPASRRALERRFRKHLDRTILQEIHRVHVERAKRLLVETNRPLQGVATESGLTDINHLLRLFKKIEGITPGEYRELFQAR